MDTNAAHQQSAIRLQGGLLRFFVLVVLLSVPFWLLGGRPLPGAPLNLPVSALSAVVPLVTALIVTYQEDGREGTTRLLRRIADHKRIERKIWYLPIALTMPTVMALSYWLMRLTGQPLPDPRITWWTIPVLFAAFFVSAVGEEAGWMGYAADPMQRRWSALTTGIILGLIWVVLHFIPLHQAHRTPAWIAWWSVTTVVLRVLIVWLYNNTGKSVFAAILFHAMINVSNSLFPDAGSHYDPAFAAPILVIMAAIVTYVWGPTTLARRRHTPGGARFRRRRSTATSPPRDS